MAAYSVMENALLCDAWLATSVEFVGIKQKGMIFLKIVAFLV